MPARRVVGQVSAFERVRNPVEPYPPLPIARKSRGPIQAAPADGEGVPTTLRPLVKVFYGHVMVPVLAIRLIL